MKLDELSTGTVYVDTNVLSMYLPVDSVYLPTIRAFLGRVVRGAIAAFVSVPVLDELFYRLLLARVKDSTGRNPLVRRLRHRPHDVSGIIPYLSRIASQCGPAYDTVSPTNNGGCRACHSLSYFQP